MRRAFESVECTDDEGAERSAEGRGSFSRPKLVAERFSLPIV